MFYRLPTRSPRKYRGAYPDRVHSFSSSVQRAPEAHKLPDPAKLIRLYHVELNDGSRYVFTCAEMLTVPNLNTGTVGRTFASLVHTLSNCVDMTQATYDVWLEAIREDRALPSPSARKGSN